MKKKGTLFIGLVAMALLLIVILVFNWQRVETEKEIAIDVVEILNQEGYTGLEVNTAGLGGAVSLSGTMRSQDSIDYVNSLIGKVDGVTDVDTAGVVLKPLRPANLSLRSNGQAMTLLGSTSSELSANEFKAQVEALMDVPVDHGMIFDSEVETPVWLGELATVLPTFVRVEGLQVNVQNKVLQISGVSRDESEYQAIIRGTQNLEGIDKVDTSGLILKLRDPAWFLLANGDLTGTFASQAESLRLGEILSNLISVEVNQKLEVDESYADAKWLQDLERLDVNSQAVESAIVGYRDNVMRVSGVIRSQAVFDNLASQAPALVYTKQLDLSALLLRPYQPPWIQLQVSEDKIALTGGVKEASVAEALLQIVMDASGEKFSRVIDNQLQYSTDFSAAEWALDIKQLLSGIARTEEGSLSLKEGILSLSGVVREEEIFDQLKEVASSFDLADQIELSELKLRPWKKPKFAVSIFEKKAIVSGRVGDGKAAKLLGEAVGLVFGDESSIQVLVDPDVTEAPWLNGVMRMMPAMTGLENASLTATDAKIDIAGIARTQESYELVTNALTEIGNQDVNNLVVLRPWQQPILELLSDGIVLRSIGMMPNETAVESVNAQLEILADAKGLTLESNVKSAPDIETPSWLVPVTQAIPDLSVLDMPGLRISEGVMTLLGQTTDQVVADSIVTNMTNTIDGLLVESAITYVPPLEVLSGVGEAAVAEEATKEEIDQCEQRLDAQMEGKRIEFASSSAAINENSTPVLGLILEELKDCPDVLIEVAGHTDSSGNNESNLVLSEQRAQAVVDYLVTAGIPKSRLQAQGYGSEYPIAGNETVEGRAENRRIEFNIE